jgi:uncharacterized protein DUF4190
MSYPPNPGNWPDPSSTPYQHPAPPPGAAPAPGSGPPGYGYGGYPPPGYPAPGYPPGPPKTNGMAVAAMVTSIASAVGLLCAFCFGPLGLLALGGGVTGTILGFVARRQIRERGEQGDGMALTGLIVGLITAGIGVLVLILMIAWIGWSMSYDSSSFS